MGTGITITSKPSKRHNISNAGIANNHLTKLYMEIKPVNVRKHHTGSPKILSISLQTQEERKG